MTIILILHIVGIAITIIIGCLVGWLAGWQVGWIMDRTRATTKHKASPSSEGGSEPPEFRVQAEPGERPDNAQGESELGGGFRTP